MSNQRDMWAQIEQLCQDTGPAVGAVTGAAYGIGAEAVTKSPVAAAAVDKLVGDFVEQNWANVCDLPVNLGASNENSPSPATDPASPADSSSSPDR